MVVQWLMIITTREYLEKVTINKTIVKLALRFGSGSQLKILKKPRHDISKITKYTNKLKNLNVRIVS